jgi:hypothetical protein
MTQRPIKVWNGTAWEYTGPAVAAPPVKYQATEPTSPATGDVWVESDYDVASVDPSKLLTGGVYTNESTRSAAIPTPTEGMLAVTTDNDKIDYYNGSGWVPALPVGAWEAYTPTFTNLTVGNATVNFTYAQIGKTVHVRGSLTFGASTAITGAVSFSAPVNLATSAGGPVIGLARYNDSGTASYVGIVSGATGSTLGLVIENVAGTYPTIANLSSSVPFLWTTSDALLVSATYQAA